MRLKIENGKDFEKLQELFKSYNIEGHIEVGIDGVWFVIDKIEKVDKYEG